MILNDFTAPKPKFSNAQLNEILAELCGLVLDGQRDNPDFYGMVAAAVIDPRGRLATGVNYVYGNGRVHAERAAIDRYEGEYGELPRGSVVVTTLSPCSQDTHDNRHGESCTDLLNSKHIKMAYCGYKDPTQDSQNKFTVVVTDNGKLKELCKKLADTFLDEDYDPNGPPPGPEFPPTMPAGTVRVDVSDVYDWYKLGQHISNLKGLGKHDFGKGPPSTIISFGSEEAEHKYLDALKKTGLDTTDIDPVDPNQPRGMKRQKTDPTYNVNENFADGKVKGKSRPGRVKKAGASCSGSVTDLRRRAKNASGERAKMYHWCANMKSGKKKKTNEVTQLRKSNYNIKKIEEQFGPVVYKNEHRHYGIGKLQNANKRLFDHCMAIGYAKGFNIFCDIIDSKEYVDCGKTHLNEDIDPTDQNLIKIFNRFNSFNTNNFTIGDNVYLIELSAVEGVATNNKNIYIEHTTKPLEIVDINQNYITFANGQTYPDKFIQQTKRWSQLIMFADEVKMNSCLATLLIYQNKIGNWTLNTPEKLNEVITNPNVKTKGASNTNLVNKGNPIPAGKEAKLLGSKVGKLKQYEVYKFDQGNDSAYSIFDPETRTSQLTVSGHNKPHAFEIFGVYSGPSSPVRAADLYAWLVQNQGLTLLSDRQQSPGGQRVWQELEQRYGRSINVYAFNMRTNQPINTGADDPESTHGTRGDIAQNVRLVAAPK